MNLGQPALSIALLAALAATAAALVLGWRLARAGRPSAGPLARHAVIEGMADGVIVLDAQRRIVDINPAAAEMVGCLPADALGRPADGLLAGWPGLAASPGEAVEARGGIVLECDGATRALEISITPLLDEAGRPQRHLVMLRDVSAEQAIHEKLQASEAHFQGILDAASSAIIAVDEEQRIIVFNRMAEHIFGYPAVEVLGKPLGMLLPERHRTGHMSHVETFAGGDEPWRQMGHRTVALFGQRQDGTEFPAEVSLSRFEADGKPILTAVLNDITLRQQTEKALLESEAKFRTLAETTPAAICLARVAPGVHEPKLLYVNSAAEAVTGYTHAELMAMDIRDLIHPASRELASPEYLERLPADGQPSSHQIRIVTKEGDTRWVNLTIVLATFDGEPAILSTAFDITDAKRIEEALHLSEDRYRILVENINDVIFALDIQGNFTYVSPVIKRLSEYQASEIIGRPIRDFVHPGDLDDLQRSFAQALTGQPEPIEFRLQAKGGSILHVRANARPVLADGQPLGLTGTLTDITETRRVQAAEREQRVLAEALRDTAAVLTSTLDLDEVLERILANAGRVVPHDASTVMLIHDGMSQVVRSDGFRGDEMHSGAWREGMAVGEVAELRQMVESGQPLLIPEYALPGSKPGRICSYMGAPIRMGGEMLGFLNLYLGNESQHAFSPAHLDRLQVFADEAAIAIRNAQLYEQAQQIAMMEERQRLARDLHDAVSQTLFSANVIAQMLPRMWQKNPDEVHKRLDQLHMLTQGALAEMRTLLLELRPAALADAQLADLLRHLTDALTGRKQIEVRLDVDGQPALPPDVKVAFYRIAQEALNNVAKHSNATETRVTLRGSPQGVEMTIYDNGRGIDPERIAPDRMGLTIMQERAEAISADFKLSSQPGSGTEVTVSWPEGD